MSFSPLPSIVSCPERSADLLDRTQPLPHQPGLSHNIVFIDAGVANPEQLMRGLVEGVEAHLLSPFRDAVEQITTVLQGHGDFANVHIISHGAPGCLYLGQGELSLDTLEQYGPQLATWFAEESASSLLLYGCNAAAGDAGEEFLEKLHHLTGVEVAASTTRIGHASEGGNWQLDWSTGRQAGGEPTGAIAFTQALQDTYPGTFAIPVSIRAAPSAGGEAGTTQIVLTVATDDGSNVTGDQTVRLILDGASSTATGNDFVGTIPSSITIPDGQSQQTLTLEIENDEIIEGEETANFLIFITDPSSGIELGTTTGATVTITDDEIPQVNFTVEKSNPNPSEADGTGITLIVEATQAVQGNQTVNLALTGSATANDFSSEGGGSFPTSITIPDGQRKAEINLTIADDGLIEVLENATFTISTPTSGIALGPVTEQSLSITDNDQAGFDITESGGSTTVAEPNGTDSFDVVLTAQPLSDVVINVANSNDQAATVGTSQLSFTSSNWDQPQTITVTAANDDVVDGTQTNTVTLAIDVANSADQFDGVSPQTVTVSSTDDDAASVILSNNTALTTTEASGNDSFGVRLGSEPTANVTLSFASSDVSEGVVAPSITFTPQNWDQVQTVTITGQDDDLADGNVGYTITTTVSSSDSNYDGFTVAPIAVTNSDNDTAGLQVSTSSVTVAEPSTTDSFTLALTAQPSSNVVLQLSSNDTSEASVTPSATFTPSNWNIPQTITVTGADDGIVDGPQSSQITISVDAGNSDDAFDGVADEAVAVTTNDNDTAGFSLSTNALTVGEDGSTQTFTVVLDAEPSSNVVLTVSSDDTEEATATPTPLTFTTSDWNQPQTVTVTGIDDTVADGNQSSTVTVAVDAGNSDDVFDGLSSQVVTVTTTDDEVANFTLTPTDGTTAVTEGGATDSFTVVLDAEPTGNVVLNVNSSDSGEAALDQSTLTFTPSNWNQSQTVTVTAGNDTVVDGTQSSQITVSVDAGASSDAYDGVASQVLDVTTADDETADFTVTETDGNTTVDEAGTITDNFAVVLTAEPEGTVTFNVSSSDTGEAAVSPQTLTFNSTNWNAPQAVTVAGIADGAIDGAQTSTIRVSVNDAASLDLFDDLADKTFDATVQDSDQPGFTVIQTDNVTQVQESAPGNTDTFTVQLNAQPQSNVVIDLSGVDTNAATLSAGGQPVEQLAFTSADWNLPQTVTVTGVDNQTIEGDRSSTLTLSIVDGQSDASFATVEDQSFSVTTQNDDTAGFTITETTGTTQVSETGTTDTFDVILTAEPSSDVKLTVVSGNINEATVDTSELTFTPSDWNIPQTVTVTGADDSAIDGSQSTDITLAVDAGNSDAAFGTVENQTVTVTTIDDDQPGITITPATPLTTTEAGGTASLDVVLNKQPSATVTVAFSSSDETEGEAPTSIEFTTENWNVVQTVTITGLDETEDDGDIDYQITVSLTSEDAGYAALTPEAIALTNTDDDENTPPLLGNEILDQNAQAGVLFEFSIPSGTFIDTDDGEILTFAAAQQDQAGLVNLPTWLSFNQSSQTFTGTPTAADVGSFEVNVTVSDRGQLSVSDIFQINVLAPSPEPEVPEPPATDIIQPIVAEPTDPGTTQPFSLRLTQGQTALVNELIAVQTDDAQGNINGIAPGEAGYSEALLQRATVVFSTLKAGRIPDLTTSRTLNLPGDGTFQFAVIENGSLDSLRQGGAGTLRLATSAGSGQSLIQASEVLSANAPLALQVPLSNEDGVETLSNIVLETGAATSAPLGSALQGNGQESELLDFRNETGTRTATFEVYRDAKFDNLVGFYFVENEQGQVRDSQDTLLNPGDAGYRDAALANRLTDVNLTGQNGSVEIFSTEIAMGQLLAPFIIVDGGIEQLLDSNLGNDPSIYFTHIGANGDGTDHVRLIGDNTFGFEDLVNGGDMDFDDIVVKALIA